ncbi:hypothetical protein DXV76_13520 [Rhodobacteraceae bacterium CCMM004]|nr:hypothetical protein DXV76_13520 [Rhodobacteraceae bacterium CCMM004]
MKQLTGMVSALALGGGVLAAAPATAEEIALILGNGAYTALDRVREGTAAVDAARALERAGVDVVSQADGRIRDMQEAVARFEQMAPRAERLLVVLSGQFLHTDAETYFLPVNSDTGPLSTLSRQALPLSVIFAILAEAPERAVLVLGASPGREEVGRYLESGPGIPSLPPGVTLLSGPPERVDDFVRDILAVPGRTVRDGLTRYPSLRIAGFVPQGSAFVDPARDDARERRAWQDAQAADTVESYRAYLRAFPDGRNAEAARFRIAAIEADVRDWAAAERTRTVAGYRDYLRANPGGRYADQAREAIARLEREAEDVRWRRAAEIDSVAAYRDYLDAYPSGRYATRARDRIDALQNDPERIAREAEADLNLSRSDRVEIQENLTVLGYNTRGVDGIFGPGTRGAISTWQRDSGLTVTGYLDAAQVLRLDREADARRDRIAQEEERARAEAERADRAYWRDQAEGQGIDGMRRYLDRFPNGIYADEARTRLAILEDRRDWRQASNENTVAALARYLNRHPNGEFAVEARRRLEDLRAANAESESDRQERRYWEQVRAQDAIATYRQYLDRYPNGRYAAEARDRIAILEADARSAGNGDQQAWNRARQIDTAEAYRAYLSQFPNGAFADRARRRLERLAPSDPATSPDAARATERALGLNSVLRAAIEQRLRAIGYDPGRPDGEFDAQARAAIRAYQQDNGLPATGYLDQATVAKLTAGTIGDIIDRL